MRILITGAGGFVGQHLVHHLRDIYPDAELYGTVLQQPATPHSEYVDCHELDLKNEEATFALIKKLQPDCIYHLAAQAFVPRSFEDPWETLENNIRAQLNVILGCLKANIRPRMLIISSAEIYGAVQPDELPLSEAAPLRPSSPYSVSKIAQDMLGLQYHISHEFPIMRARPFNHFGPGQSERFVAPAFAIQIARIEAGLQEPIIYVGNLAPQRDFTDVRDIVRAYRLIMDKGTSGEAYNIASGKTYSAQDILDVLFQYTDVEIEVRVDESRLRPVDIPIIQGDATRLQATTGWQPEIPFEQTLKDVLEDCRQRVKQERNF
ncbi:MAG: SDR family oxidoreductase [Chloroflexi bacterium]|nr:MAG: SDR family oxidoreductase [Chloroflexota bacterium]